MKFLSLLVLSAAGTALARGGGGDDSNSGHGRGGGRRWRNSTATSTKSQCRQVARLTSLTALAADPSKLAEATKDDAEKAAAIQAKAAAAAERLSALQSNSTLMDSCSSILAADAMEDACWTMAHLEKMSALVANTAALGEKDAEKIEKIKAEVAESADELAKMQGNSTLTEFCSVWATKESCRKMAKLERWVGKGSVWRGGIDMKAEEFIPLGT